MNYIKSIMYALICVLILFVLLSLRQRNQWEAKRFKWEAEKFQAWRVDRVLLEEFRESQRVAAEAKKAAEEEKKAALHKKRQLKEAK